MFHSSAYEDTYFLATIVENFVSSVPDPLVFDEIRINPGGHYDPTTGIYTVPQNGTYEFYVHLMNGPDTNDLWAFSLVVDDANVDYNLQYEYPDYISDATLEMLELSSGQQVSVSPLGTMDYIAGSTGGVMASWFSGRLIKAA